MSGKTDRCWCRFILEIKTLPSDLPDCYHDRCAPSSDAARCSAAYLVFGADRLGRARLQQLNRCSIVKYERNSNSNRWLSRCDQNLPTFEGFVQIVDGESDVRNNPDNLGHVAMRLEPDPLDPVGTGLKTGDVNPELPDMMLPSTRLCVCGIPIWWYRHPSFAVTAGGSWFSRFPLVNPLLFRPIHFLTSRRIRKKRNHANEI